MSALHHFVGHRLMPVKRMLGRQRFTITAALGLALTASALPLSAQRPVPGLEAVRDLRIDATANDLSRIRSILVLRNGNIVVPQGVDHRLRFFDARGDSTGSFGRDGAGPGEFRVVGIFGTVGDTIWVGDGRNARTTYIGPDRKLVRTAPFVPQLKAHPADETGLSSGTGGGFYGLAEYADGSFLTSAYLPSNFSVPAWYSRSATAGVLAVASADGVVRRVIAINRAAPAECRVSGSWDGKITFTGWIPFCDQSVRAIAQDGSRIAFVAGNGAGGSDTTYRVTVIAGSGDTIFSRTYGYRPLRIPRRVADSTVNAQAGTPHTPPQAASVLRAMKLPPTYPPVLRALVGLDGTIWLDEPALNAVHRWQILDLRGVPIATAVVPLSVRALVVDRGHIWGIDTDADGLQSVVRFVVK